MAGQATSGNRRLLCEGWLEAETPHVGDSVMYPERAYVVQTASPAASGRIWYAFGKPERSLAESISQKHQAQIVESYEQLELEERKLPDGSTAKLPKNGVWIVEGPFQRSDVKNANRRVYPRAIWERLIGDDNSYVQQTIRARGMLGHLEHPTDGRTDGNKGALVVTGAKLNSDGVVWGEAEILDTPSGLILQEYTRKRVRWGVSSRGNGEVKEDGVVEAQSFVLETWDAVMKPSVPGAYPSLMTGKTVADATQNTAKAKNESSQAVAESDEAVAYAAKVRELSETQIDALSSTARAKLTKDLIGTLDRGSSLVSSGVLPAERAFDLQGFLTRKLNVLSGSQGMTLDEAIEAAIREAEQPEVSDAEAAFDRVVGSLKQRLGETTVEAQSLREQLEAAESRACALQGQCDEMTEQLSDAEARLADTQSKLTLAEDLLATRPSAPTANGRVMAAVENAIQQVPDLSEFRDLLEGAVSAEEVEELAERLLPVAVRATPTVSESTSPARVISASRATLPVGIVESDDADVIAPDKPSFGSYSEGARMAAQILAIKSTV